ncbi:MAG TPA: type II toxin-antitoxin system VapC family toxin [Thermoanaerobaculia bacterium]|nr:type II toxin-antitoxin system VapC family toxin [Thermoanaerobaculia bacterium]
MILLDTHALIWLDAGDSRFGRKARRTADKALVAGDLAVSAVSFWEAAMLRLRGRISLQKPLAAWRLSLIEAGLAEIALTGEIGILAASLEDLPGDPADRMIAATAAHQGATLLTGDRAILDWKGDLRRQDARA